MMPETFPENFFYLRTQILKHSQTDMSKLLRVSRKYLADIESGKTAPSEKVLTELGRNGISTAYLYSTQGAIQLPLPSWLKGKTVGERMRIFREFNNKTEHAVARSIEIKPGLLYLYENAGGQILLIKQDSWT